MIKYARIYGDKLGIGDDIFSDKYQDKLKYALIYSYNILKNYFDYLKRNNEIPEGSKYYDKILKAYDFVLDKKIPLPKKELSDFKNSVNFNFDFWEPRTSSQSFGWRSEGEKESAKVSFKEPYSTYFYNEGAELFLNSDQVVADPNGQISGKILALPNEAQQKYAQTVVKPLLLNYFKSIQSAPKEYFIKTGKNYNQLLVECKDSSTLIDALKFIQKYIIKPTS